MAIDDVDGTLSEEEFIEFEDGLLFYNPQKSVVDDEEYLVTIPMKEKGLRKSSFRRIHSLFKSGFR